MIRTSENSLINFTNYQLHFKSLIIENAPYFDQILKYQDFDCIIKTAKVSVELLYIGTPLM